MRRLPFSVALRHPVMGVTTRSGYLLEGPAGWGECSPLPSWNDAEREAAERSALEAATLPFPHSAARTCRRQRDGPAGRARRRSGARAALGMRAPSRSRSATICPSIGSPLSGPRADPACTIRLDANGRGTSRPRCSMLAHLAPYDIELIEDPVASLEELASLRGHAAMPVAAESCIRTTADARRLHELEAADAIVLKPQRIGGVREALRAAEAAGVPAIASSALETSVGLAAVVASRPSLPDAPFAHGVGTALLLESDVVAIPCAGRRLADPAPPGGRTCDCWPAHDRARRGRRRTRVRDHAARRTGLTAASRTCA